ncbi:HoxN/HupN/NixA family nickel/cobalt transporter [Agromyces sp. Q22]|uniref:Nickel/cobalt efflux system n=2 Tax=Agromyces kandeliae TaxID=2666141 RepID=A0A6L5QXV7_9MICO|nr:HoxN/HupN/NixA family nickel/cobalt transporter [Agromyces kandeliae]
MLVTILALHLAGFGLLFAGGEGGTVAGTTLGVGMGVTAYVLGLRHAFDADHIAAIDNTTRKLLDDGRKPVSVGFWFSLGHSTVVLALVVLLALGVDALAGSLRDDDSALHRVTGIVGATVSGLFLYVIAAINVVLLASTWRTHRQARSGETTRWMPTEGATRGPLTRLLSPVITAIRAPWQMYPVGVLFGFGFDTATEVGLLVLAATSTASHLAWYSLLALPLLFAAGMSLLDTADGVLMRYAYGWALADGARKVRYNLAITAISVVVAVAVGTIQLVALFGDELGLGGDQWRSAAGVDLNAVGFWIVGALVLMWLGALLVSRRRQRRPVPAPPQRGAVGIRAPEGARIDHVQRASHSDPSSGDGARSGLRRADGT